MSCLGNTSKAINTRIMFCSFLLWSIPDALFSEQIAELGRRQGGGRRRGKTCCLPTAASILSEVYLSIDSFSKLYLNTHSMPRSRLGSGILKARKTQFLLLKILKFTKERQNYEQIIKILYNKCYIRNTIKVLETREDRAINSARGGVI